MFRSSLFDWLLEVRGFGSQSEVREASLGLPAEAGRVLGWNSCLLAGKESAVARSKEHGLKEVA